MIDPLSVVVPAYNEAMRLPATLAALRAYLDAEHPGAEVIVVDDGSNDATADVAARCDPRAVCLRQDHAGKGAAVRRGVLAARGRWILLMDADMAIPIEAVEGFAPATADHAVIIGSKRAAGADVRYPLLRRVGGALGQLWIRLLVVGGFEDTQCGFKLLRRDVARALFAVQRLDGFGYDFEILYLARRYGIAVREMPVRCRHVAGGTVRIRAYARTFVEALAVAWNRLCRRYPRALPDG